MKILTISASPYLLTRNGRINNDLLRSFHKAGHSVESCVWNHDPVHFMANEAGEHNYRDRDGTVVKIHPFLGEKGEFVPFLFQKMKVIQPDVVVTIGNYRESCDIWPIKRLYSRLFKWIAIFTEGNPVINEHFRERLLYPDYAVLTTKPGLEAFRGLSSVPSEYIPYGPSGTFEPLEGELTDDFGIISMAKNAQLCNPAAFIRAAVEADVPAYLHTNIDDDGEYDLRLLVQRYDKKGRITLPYHKFVSLREGVTDPHLNVLYNRSHAIVDCSMQSATALTTLEAMTTGCVPVGMDFGAVGEVIGGMPEEFRFTVPYDIFIGPSEEEYAMPNVKGLVDVLKGMKERHSRDKNWFSEARRQAMARAAIFSKEKFLTRVNEILDSAVAWLESVAVDSY